MFLRGSDSITLQDVPNAAIASGVLLNWMGKQRELQ